MLNKMREMIPNMINMYKEGQKAYKQWTDISDDINQAETSLNENPLFTVIEVLNSNYFIKLLSNPGQCNNNNTILGKCGLGGKEWRMVDIG